MKYSPTCTDGKKFEAAVQLWMGEPGRECTTYLRMDKEKEISLKMKLMTMGINGIEFH